MRLLALLLRLALAIVAALLIAELAVAWLAPQPLLVVEPGLYEADPPGRYRLSPGYRGSITNLAEFDDEVTTDERGLRESGVGGDGPKILAIGDSFTFGIGVGDDETFVARLADQTGATPLNGGLAGTGVPDVVGWYGRHGRALAPDIVILAVFVGNDLADARPDREPIRIVDGLVAPADTPAGLSNRLYRRSHLFRLLRSAAGSPALAGLRERLGLREPWVVRNLRWEFSIYALDPPEQLVAAEAITEEAIGRLAAWCAEDGTLLGAMLVPARIQLTPEAWAASIESIGLDPADYDRFHPTEVFEGILERNGVPWLDLRSTFAAALARGEDLYYAKDRHWNAAGHELAARELERFLERLDALP